MMRGQGGTPAAAADREVAASLCGLEGRLDPEGDKERPCRRCSHPRGEDPPVGRRKNDRMALSAPSGAGLPRVPLPGGVEAARLPSRVDGAVLDEALRSDAAWLL